MIKPGGRGKSFEALIVYSFNSTTCSYAVRLRENIKGAFCLRCHNYINLSSKQRQQPFDYIVVHQGRPFAIEAKSVHGVSFPFRNIKEHQLIELEKFEQHGSAHVLLEFIQGKGRKRKYFLIPISRFKLFMETAEGKKSLSISKIEKAVVEDEAYEVEYKTNDKKKHVIAIGVVLDKVVMQRWSK